MGGRLILLGKRPPVGLVREFNHRLRLNLDALDMTIFFPQVTSKYLIQKIRLPMPDHGPRAFNEFRR